MLSLKKRLKPAEQGFTLVEVLVAILITTLFVGVAMQTMVFAAIFKAKAQEYTEATTWIQEDLEQNVKYQADSLQFPQTTLTTDAAKGASLITVASGSIFANNDTFRIGLDPNNYTISSVIGNTLSITPALAADQVQNAAVVATKRCNPSAQNAGLADGLRDSITDTNHTDGITNITTNDNPVSFTKNFRTGKTFSLSRTTTLSATSPYSVLEVTYSVAPQNAHTTLTAAASATSNTLNVASTTGFNVGDQLTVGTDVNNNCY